MKLWQVMAMTDIDELPTLAKRAEELGFEGVTLGDHLVTFATQYEAYDYSDDSQVLWYPETHWPDPWVQIGALAQITTRLKFLNTIYVLPMRDPLNAAKAISTAVRISNDRVVLGVGIGWQETEFRIAGQSFKDRGKRTDEMLQVMKLLMSGDMVEFHGEFYDFEPLQMSPGIKRDLPIMIGGYSPAAFRRAARHDGWVGSQHDIEEVAPIVAALQQARSALAKDGPFEIILGLKKPTADNIRRAAELGVTLLFRGAWLDQNGRASTMTLQQKLDDMARFAEQQGLV